MQPPDIFPVKLEYDFRQQTVRRLREHGDLYACVGVPRAMLVGRADRFLRNHGATLNELAQRGGISIDECIAVLEDRRWAHIDEAEAHSSMRQKILAWEAAEEISLPHRRQAFRSLR